MATEMNKTYNPSEIEDRLYKKWLDKKYFHAEVDRSKKPFTIVMPPPNITGQLHMGHALDNTLQDILIRFKRMQGYNALWQPGTDHASIATEVKVTNKLREEGIDKEELGREGFLKRTWEWREEYGGRIVSQLKKLGSSADWDRERFTMDEGCSKAVQEVFIRLYEKGYIYQGSRIINWCPVCQTSISDAEVEYEDQAGHFWHINYPIVGTDKCIEIATTRPETMLGDTAIAVHPDDERYKDLVGKMVLLPIVNKEIPIVADSYVDKEFGTGAVKITPAHDPNDFEVGKRHNLEEINILNDDGTINENGGKFEGMDRYEARKAIVKELEEGGYLVRIENHEHNVGTHDRCHTTVEPMVKKQWFVKMNEMAKPAIEAVKNGDLRFVPGHFDRTYLHWLENIRDWCISRQLWWGHRIPAYYCDDCGEIVVAKETPSVCPKCGCTHFTQDEDTLDTWFSSALWPFSTLGWPDKTEDLDYFYPTSVLVTGYDIIPFWVMRMMFSALEHTGEVPFKHVFIHGLVRDSQGRKMSKSLGNGIDPLEIVDQYGADALRFTLATGNAPGNDMRFYIERVEASRNFANKIWNASRFTLMNLDVTENKLPDLNDLQLEDKWILSKYNDVVKSVTENLDKFELGIALSNLYDFIWENFCDWYIELVKPRLFDKENPTGKTAQYVLTYVLSNTMKLLHPFMPFITEEIWQHLPHEGESIMISEWPEYDEKLNFPKDVESMELIMQSISAIRNRRAEMNVPPSKKAKVIIVTDKTDVFEQGTAFFEKLASASEAVVQTDKSGISDNAVNVVVPSAEVFLPLDELVDKTKELERLNAEKKKLEGEIKRVEGKLNNAGFVSKAPQKVVDEEKAKGEKYKEMLEKVLENIKSMENM
mgnify:CR=1 FL=1